MRMWSSTWLALAVLALTGASFFVVFDEDRARGVAQAAPAVQPGTVRITRAFVDVEKGALSDDARSDAHSGKNARATNGAPVSTSGSAGIGQQTAAPQTGAMAPMQTLPISGTIRQSDSIQLVEWQAGADAAGHFAFVGQVAHAYLAGPVYSTAVIHLYNHDERLIAMVPVEEFPRRVYAHVPRVFTLQTDIDAADVQRYAFYINVNSVDPIVSEGSELCPETWSTITSTRCTPPTF